MAKAHRSYVVIVRREAKGTCALVYSANLEHHEYHGFPHGRLPFTLPDLLRQVLPPHETAESISLVVDFDLTKQRGEA